MTQNTEKYRNCRTLTDEEIREMEKLYPVTPNRLLAKQYGISLDALQDYVAYPRGWKKDRKAVLIGNRGGRSLTEKEIAWIVKHYHHKKNDDIMEKFGIGEATLHRLARKHGLKKTDRFMKKTQRNATEVSNQVCRRYGIYEETARRMKEKMLEMSARGERFPGSFKKGESNKDRLSPYRFRKCIEKATATMRELRRKERLRMHWGLPPLTKLNISWNGYTAEARKRASQRHLFRKKNYIVERGATVVFYDELTERSVKMEENAHKYGLKVKEL